MTCSIRGIPDATKNAARVDDTVVVEGVWQVLSFAAVVARVQVHGVLLGQIESGPGRCLQGGGQQWRVVVVRWCHNTVQCCSVLPTSSERIFFSPRILKIQ